MLKAAWALILLVSLGLGNRSKIVEATSQEWIGGLRETGYGTDYRLTIKAGAGSNYLLFDELWVNGIHMKVRVSADPRDPRKTAFRKGDAVYLRAGYVLRPGPDERTQLLNADSLPVPVVKKGEGLLSYTLKGKTRYLPVREFTKLEKIIYP